MTIAPKRKAEDDADASNVTPIPLPDMKATSKYAARSKFGEAGAVTTFRKVALKKSKTHFQVKKSLAMEVDVVDAATADAMGKNLYVITPGASEAGAVDGISEAYRALAVPCVDRDGVAFLWIIRTIGPTGEELPSYIAALDRLDELDGNWRKLTWSGDGYTCKRPVNEEKLGEPQWPKGMDTFDAWLEAAFPGKIIEDCDHRVLRKLRGEE